MNKNIKYLLFFSAPLLLLPILTLTSCSKISYFSSISVAMLPEGFVSNGKSIPPNTIVQPLGENNVVYQNMNYDRTILITAPTKSTFKFLKEPSNRAAFDLQPIDEYRAIFTIIKGSVIKLQNSEVIYIRALDANHHFFDIEFNINTGTEELIVQREPNFVFSDKEVNYIAFNYDIVNSRNQHINGNVHISYVSVTWEDSAGVVHEVLDNGTDVDPNFILFRYDDGSIPNTIRLFFNKNTSFPIHKFDLLKQLRYKIIVNYKSSSKENTGSFYYEKVIPPLSFNIFNNGSGDASNVPIKINTHPDVIGNTTLTLGNVTPSNATALANWKLTESIFPFKEKIKLVTNLDGTAKLTWEHIPADTIEFNVIATSRVPTTVGGSEYVTVTKMIQISSIQR